MCLSNNDKILREIPYSSFPSLCFPSPPLVFLNFKGERKRYVKSLVNPNRRQEKRREDKTRQDRGPQRLKSMRSLQKATVLTSFRLSPKLPDPDPDPDPPSLLVFCLFVCTIFYFFVPSHLFLCVSILRFLVLIIRSIKLFLFTTPFSIIRVVSLFDSFNSVLV